MKDTRYFIIAMLCVAMGLVIPSCGGDDVEFPDEPEVVSPTDSSSSSDSSDKSSAEQEEEDQKELDNLNNSDETTTEEEDAETVEKNDSTTNVPSFDYTITSWSGDKATDASSDAIDYSNSDLYWEANTFSNTVVVSFQNSVAYVSTSNSDIKYNIDGTYVTIDMQSNSVSNVEIQVSGVASDGQLKIYGEKKFKLTLNGLELTCKKGPAINDQCHKRAFVHVADGTTNILTDYSTYSTEPYYLSSSSSSSEDRKGTFFSEGNLIFSGTGVLQVAGKYKHGIASDGYIYIRPGVTLVVTEAAKNAVHANGDEDDVFGIYMACCVFYTTVSSTAGKGMKCDYDINIAGGNLLLNTSGGATYDTSEGDTSSASGIKSDTNVVISGGTHTIKSTGKGGKGISCDGTIYFKGGTTTLATSGTQYTYSSSITSSPKGVKAQGNIYITGGALSVSVTGQSDGSEGIESKSSIYMTGGSVYSWAYDDAVNASSSIVISGGKLFAYGSNNDGIDSNGIMTISGGLVIGCGTSEPECGIDCDDADYFKINGGTVISMGGQAFQANGQSSASSAISSSCAQCVSIYNTGLTATSGKLISLLNSSGTPVITFEYPRTLSTAGIAFSCSGISTGSTYTLSSGGTLSGYTDSWNGWYDGGTWSNGTTIKSFTQSSTVTSISSSSSSSTTPGGSTTPDTGGTTDPGGSTNPGNQGGH